MKITEKKKPINTIPKGVWESSRPTETHKGETASRTRKSTSTTDLQGNGYPENNK